MEVMSHLFVAGTNLDMHGILKIRDSPRKMNGSKMKMFMISGMESIGKIWQREIKVNEFGGTKRVLMSDWKEEFVCLGTLVCMPRNIGNEVDG